MADYTTNGINTTCTRTRIIAFVVLASCRQHKDLQNNLGYTGMLLLYGFDQCKVHEIHMVRDCKDPVSLLELTLK
jgi:hypothetical protein